MEACSPVVSTRSVRFELAQEMSAFSGLPAGGARATFPRGRRFEGQEVFGWWPAQERTGKRGYLGKFGSRSESWQSRNSEPFSEAITRACRQFRQSPGGATCGGDFSRSTPSALGRSLGFGRVRRRGRRRGWLGLCKMRFVDGHVDFDFIGGDALGLICAG
jgi:hypothetical protein